MDNLSLLLKTSYTRAQVAKNLGLLRDFLQYWLFNNLDLKVAMTEYTKNNLQSSILSNLPEEFYHQFNKTNVTEILKDLETKFGQIKTLTICLPLELPESEINELGIHLRSTFQTPMLIEFKLDPSLIAGPALIYNGVYKDYSIKTKIAQNRSLIIETLKKASLKHE